MGLRTHLRIDWMLIGHVNTGFPGFTIDIQLNIQGREFTTKDCKYI